MWNNPQAAAYEAQPDADPYAEVTWSPDQLQRMESEWRRLQRAFAYHPHVTLAPLRGDPPTAYQVDYRIQTLVVNPRSGQLEYVQNATVHITLPPGFPEDAPVVKPVTPIFHPNVSYEALFIEGLWHPNETLLGLVRKVGEVLAYRSYDPDYAVNPAAMDWLAANHQILPVDGQANLAPTAGGEPLGRIVKFGPQSLDSMKQSVLATQSALFGASAPEDVTVKDYSHKTILALNLFLEKDVPENLQAQASDLEQAARDLVEYLPVCAYIRERRAKVAGTRAVVKQLLASKEPLAAEVDKLAGLVESGEIEEPMVALKLIPDSGKLQPLQFSLPKMIGEAEKRVSAIKVGVQMVETLPQPPMIPSDTMLGKRLERELTTGAADADAARREAAEAMKAFEPVLRRAIEEGVALDFAARWREYMDMATKARGMERQIREWGAEGLQAYYIENESGRFGPFQFEQSVDLGAGDLIVRSLGGKAFEVRDPKTDKQLGKANAGNVVIALPGAPAPAGYGEEASPPTTIPTKFIATERCDDLMVLLEFLRRSTIETVQKFAAYNGSAESWAGKVCRVLSRPEVKKALEDELAGAARRWRHTIHDLHALAPWKERLATYFLAYRCAEEIPPLVETISDRKAKHSASKKKVASIMTYCTRDVETGTMVVPPKYSKQYHAEMKLQEECALTVKSATARLKSLVTQLTHRLQNAKLLGAGATPRLRTVPPLPEALATLPLADGQIGNLVAPLEELVQAPLGGPAPEAVAEPTHDAAAYAEGGEADHEYAGEHSGEHAYAEGEEGHVGEEAAYAGDAPEYADGYGEAGADAAAVEADIDPGHDLEEVVDTPAPAAPPPIAAAPVAPPPPPRQAAAEPELPEASQASHEPSGHDAGDQWAIIEDDEPSAYAEHEQTDVAFGFDPDPQPPTK